MGWGRSSTLKGRSHRDSCSFQLRVLLHQLFQTEARELYRNLGAFPVAFALIDHAFTVLGMPHPLAGAESGLAGAPRLRLGCYSRHRALLAPRSEAFRDVLN